MHNLPPDTSFLLHSRYTQTQQLITQLHAKTAQHPDAARQQLALALDWMLRAHYAQRDREDGPYPNHPLRVALHVLQQFGEQNPDVIMAALLHDTVEDQAEAIVALAAVSNPATTPQQQALSVLATQFGTRVAQLVGYLTNPDFSVLVKEAAANGRFVTRNTLYLDHIIHLYEQDSEAFLIKLADFWQNAGHLYRVTDGQRQENLRRKYGPVMTWIIDTLSQLDDPAHRLFAHKEDVVQAFTAVYQRDYHP
ncbi:MAG: bifunctional (p)ppGpp synthetase/guanosine-3',5'-bis(diphosphate) 3'-pyrophosphohydrolase [Anaerolineales bacterium]|nr:bifunctional (p)ppGpp synthetase/guanosine-3',5'-bis(diphosphate) 3'-pyrophosphohydrolase [Anaerolineales bacterium]